MTLALLVSFGTLLFYLLILLVRWLRVRPSSEGTSRHAAMAAAGLSGALIGGGYPIIWVMIANLLDWYRYDSKTFAFAGHLPPGVDEDDFLAVLVVGLLWLIGLTVAEVWRACR